MIFVRNSMRQFQQRRRFQTLQHDVVANCFRKVKAEKEVIVGEMVMKDVGSYGIFQLPNIANFGRPKR